MVLLVGMLQNYHTLLQCRRVNRTHGTIIFVIARDGINTRKKRMTRSLDQAIRICTLVLLSDDVFYFSTHESKRDIYHRKCFDD